MASLQQPPTSVTQEPAVEEYIRALESERTRADEVERMYEELKKIHEDCIEEFKLVQNQNQKFLSESEDKLKRSDESIRELRRISLEQVREIAELKSNVFTPQKQEVLRLTIQTEVEKTFQGKIRTLTDENVLLKSKVSTLTHENGSLRADMESRENDFKRIKNDLSTKFERKMEDLKKEKEAVSLSTPRIDLERLRQLQRDNDKLTLRVKAQEIELETVRISGSKEEEERERESKSQIRRLAEKDLLIDNLKAESEIQRSHVETIKRQLSDMTAEVKQSLQKILGLEEEKQTLESEIDNLRHRHQIEVGKEKVRLTTESTVILKEKNKLEAETERLKSEAESLKQMLDNQRKLLTDKEHATQLKITSLIQQHAIECSELEEKRHQIERKLMAAENKVTEMESIFQTKMESIMEEQKTILIAKGSIQKELDSYKVKVAHYQKVEMDLAHLQVQHAQMQQETKLLLNEIGSAESTMKSAESEKLILKSEIDELHRQQLSMEQRFNQLGAQYADEKFELQEIWAKKLSDSESETRVQTQKVDELKRDLASLRDKWERLRQKHSRYKKRTIIVTKELIVALKTKSALLDLAKDSVSPEVHQRSQDEIAQLKQSLSRLRSIIIPNNTTSGLDIPTTSSTSVATHRQLFNNVLDKKSPAELTNTGEDFEAILDRLRPLGLNGYNIESPDNERDPAQTSISSNGSRRSSVSEVLKD